MTLVIKTQKITLKKKLANAKQFKIRNCMVTYDHSIVYQDSQKCPLTFKQIVFSFSFGHQQNSLLHQLNLMTYCIQ